MKDKWLKRLILILLLLDAIVGTAFGIHICLSGDVAFFEKYYLIVFYAAIYDVVAPIYLIVKLIITIHKAIKAKLLAKAEEKARLEEERQREIERQKAIEAENQRIAKVKDDINVIINKYQLGKLPAKPKVNRIDIYADIENAQAVETVRKFKSEQISDIDKCAAISTQIKKILGANKEPDEMLAYLQSNKDTLNSCKSEYDKLILQIKTRKINIATKISDDSVVGALLKAISASEKCISSETQINELVTDEKPLEYSLFNSLVEPTVLKHNKLYHCIFDNIILVFDQDGVFLTAIRPSSLLLNFKKHSCYVEVTNDRMKQNDIIGKDSRCLQEGETTVTWMYMRKDGMPDRRHTYNPRYEHRKDKYEYGELSFKLLDTTFLYKFSSASALNIALELSYKYDAKQYDNSQLCEINYKNGK